MVWIDSKEGKKKNSTGKGSISFYDATGKTKQTVIITDTLIPFSPRSFCFPSFVPSCTLVPLSRSCSVHRSGKANVSKERIEVGRTGIGVDGL